MATQSIFHNIVINDAQTAKAFVTALENAAAVDKQTSPNISSRDLTKEEIKNYFGVPLVFYLSS